MSYHYIDTKREADPGALADVEVFEGTEYGCRECRSQQWTYVDREKPGTFIHDDQCESKALADPVDAGFYYAHGSPGCLWDSDPVGPFETEAEALKAAREAAGYCEHGISDEDICEECPAPELWVLKSVRGHLYDQRGPEGNAYDLACCHGWTDDPAKAMAWSTRENAVASRDRMEFTKGCDAVKLSGADARRWGRSD